MVKLFARVNADKLKNLQIHPDEKHRPRWPFRLIVVVVAAVVVAAAYLAWPRAADRQRVFNHGVKPATNSAASTTSDTSTSSTNSTSGSADDVILIVSGYIINRARIEISPRFLGVVKWIGVKKGDPVTNGQIVVTLDDTEYRARVAEADARLTSAKTAVQRAELNFARIDKLARTDIESKEREDDARLQLESDRAALQQAEAAYQVASTYLSWCTIRSPIDGVVLEKLVDPDELVVPQSFGGTRGPSTALIAVADPKDLQVEIDVNESDLSKIAMNRKCRVSPAAYPDHNYEGVVAEIAPEADRAKGTLQIKVQIVKPDRFLTPELSAKVEFLKGP